MLLVFPSNELGNLVEDLYARRVILGVVNAYRLKSRNNINSRASMMVLDKGCG